MSNKISINYSLIYFAAILIISQIYMHITVIDSDMQIISYCNYLKMFMTVLINTSILLYIAIKLKYSFKPYCIAISIVTIIFCIVNVLYSRVFNSYFPILLINETQNLSGLSSSITSIINPFDYLYAISMLYCLIMIIYSFKKTSSLRINNRKFICSFIIIILLFEIPITYGAFNWKAYIPYRICKTVEEEIKLYGYNKNLYTFKNGLLLTYMRDLLTMNIYKDLDQEEIQYIKSKTQRNYTQLDYSKKNLIFIIVESLMSFPIDLYINDLEITPTLNKLKEEGYYNPHMSSQIQKGMSSDGQFIYFTGLLPHNNHTTIIQYGNNHYMGLGNLLNRTKNTMVIPTIKEYWRQEKACELYGIDYIWSKEDYSVTQDSSYVENGLMMNRYSIMPNGFVNNLKLLSF